MAKDVSRKELYDLVWSTPKRILAKDFGISDVALAKICKRANVPTPGVGFWAKKEAGKRVVQGLLPERGFGMSEIITIGHDPYRQLTEAEMLAPIPDPPKFDEDMELVRGRVATLLKNVTVPKTFDRAHPVIARLLQEDEVRRQKQLASKYPSSWDAPFFDSPIDRRRLRMMNALFLAVTRLWARPYVSGRGAESCGVTVGEQHVGFKIQRVEEKRRGYRAAPTETKPRLELVVDRYQGDDSPGRWQDTEMEALESKIPEIAIELIVSGERQHRLNVAWQHKWRVERKTEREKEIRRAEEERIRKERERRAKAEREQVERLLAQASALHNARTIRGYVESVLAAELPRLEPSAAARLQDWAAWARAHADRIDPISAKAFVADLGDEGRV